MTDTRRLPVSVAEIIRTLEREAANTDTDCRWIAATELRRMAPSRTLICDVETMPRAVVVGATDPRDPDHSRPGIFAYHNCSRCDDGKRPCRQGNPRQCEFPHARDD